VPTRRFAAAISIFGIVLVPFPSRRMAEAPSCRTVRGIPIGTGTLGEQHVVQVKPAAARAEALDHA
jgi:hypothetical protein